MMDPYPRIEGIGSIGSIILAILEVQVSRVPFLGMSAKIRKITSGEDGKPKTQTTSKTQLDYHRPQVKI